MCTETAALQLLLYQLQVNLMGSAASWSLSTSIKYKVERDERYLPYMEFGCSLKPFSAGNSAEFSQADNSKTIQPTEINLTSLDSLGSCESICILQLKKTGRNMN